MTDKLIRLDSLIFPKMTKLDNGYLRGDAVAGRAGIYEYLNFDGSIIYEFRDPNELFKKEYLDGLKMIPVTNDHPIEFVTPENSHLYQKGFTGENYRIDGENIIVTLTITHKDLIDEVLKGKQGLSLAYETKVVKEDGFYKGKKYDTKQTSWNYNHLAIVKAGRAGDEAVLRFDEEKKYFFYKNASVLKNNNLINNQIGFNMTDKANEDVEITQLKYDTLKSEKDLLVEKYKHLEDKYDTLNEALKRKNDELEVLQKKDMDMAGEAMAQKRVNTVLYSIPVLGDDYRDYLKHTNKEIMCAVIAKADKSRSEKDLNTEDEKVIQGAWETIVNYHSGVSKKVDSKYIEFISNDYKNIKNDEIGSSHLNSINKLYNKKVGN